jgi:hypothetical protein
MKMTFTLAMAGLTMLAAAPSFAACTGSTTITCTGTTTSGVTDPNSASPTISGVTVASGASLNISKDAIRLYKSNVTVVNNGTVTSAKGDGIQADDATGANVTNNGSVKGANDATNQGDAVKVGDNGIVTNAGSLSAGDDGIQGGTGVTVTNSGSITAVGKGIYAGGKDANGIKVLYDNLTVTNTATGTITSSANEGISANNNLTLINRGTISANDDGVQVNANAHIDNYGTIQSTNNLTDTQDGIDLDSGTINNHAGGLIYSQYDSGIDFDAGTTSYINNAGTIRGASGIIVETGEVADHTTGLFATPNTASQIITNSGLIEATGGPGEFAGYAAYLGAGDDSLTMLAGGRLIGATDFGADADQLILDGLFEGQFAQGATMSGGAGSDLISFKSYNFADLTKVEATGDIFDLWFGSGANAFNLVVTSWESFAFKDQTVSDSRISALSAPSAVPLPAGGALMLTGLGVMALLRRRRS